MPRLWDWSHSYIAAIVINNNMLLYYLPSLIQKSIPDWVCVVIIMVVKKSLIKFLSLTTDLPHTSLLFVHHIILHVPDSPNPPVSRRSSMSLQQASRVQLQARTPPPCQLHMYLLTKPPPPSTGENQQQKLLPLHQLKNSNKFFLQ